MSEWLDRFLKNQQIRTQKLRYLCLHPIMHLRATRRLRALGSRTDRYKYLNDFLSLSLAIDDRLKALISHYDLLDDAAPGPLKDNLANGIVLWQAHVADNQPPLRIYLEVAKLAPLEGELQLRFAYRSNLFFLTFLFSTGNPFHQDVPTVLYIGGAQGGYYCQAETREAAKYNDEISPAAMLIIAVKALARTMNVDRLVAVSELLHISTSYAADHIKLDYHRFWTDAGGARNGDYYHLPQDIVSKPLWTVPQTHRARTRRKREAKAAVNAAIEQRLAGLFDTANQNYDVDSVCKIEN